MVDHQTLVDELLIVNNMSTEERLNYAQQRRTEQLMRWRDFEQELNNCNSNNDDASVKKQRHVKFGDCITLLEAAARNDYKEVKHLLQDKVNPDEANEDGLTALHQACIDNFEDIIELLLDNKANVNAVDSEYWTPLHAACTCGHTNIARILVNRGADLLALNADHNMPYDICEEDETLEFIEGAMAKKGITQDQINEARSSREKQIIQDIKEAISNGGDINAVDNVGATVLHVAAANGYVDLTRFFLLHTNNVNHQDKDGWTPLHAAACWCQIEIIEILGLQSNADPSIKNKVGETPADVTEDEEIKTLLLKLVKSQKDKKSRLFRGLNKLNGRNSSSRQSGIRGQSFKGRSKRDKKHGISAVEAKSEAEYWQKGQETDILASNTQGDDTVKASSDDSAAISTDLETSHNSSTKTDKFDSVERKKFSSLPDLQNSKPSSSKRLSGFARIFRPGSSNNNNNGTEFLDLGGETLNDLKNRRIHGNSAESGREAEPRTFTVGEAANSDKIQFYTELNGSRKKDKRFCYIL